MAAVIARARSLVCKHIADRLALPGPAGYPEEEDLSLIPEVWGGGIFLQIGDIQRLYVPVPLSVHLHMFLVQDGAAHTHLAFVSSSRACSP